MNEQPHRVWRYAALAWLVLVAVPTAYEATRWLMGIHDADMSGVGEVIALSLFFFTLPMGALAFGVFAPLGIAIDQATKGRTTRLANVLFGAALSVPALAITVIVVGWPEHSLAECLARMRHPERAPDLPAALLLAGMIVGVGLRHRGPATGILDRQSAAS